MAHRMFVYPANTRRERNRLRDHINAAGVKSVIDVDVEWCYHVIVKHVLDRHDDRINKLFSSYACDNVHARLSDSSVFASRSETEFELIEIGPRLTFRTAEGTNIVAACHAAGLRNIERVERSVRYAVITHDNRPMSVDERRVVVNSVHDRMTQCEYYPTCPNFIVPPSIQMAHEVIDVMTDEATARQNMLAINKKMGLAFDAQDVDLYVSMFRDTLKRNPTDIELFDMAQSNSEHSRHWFFKGKLVLDGVPVEQSLFQMIMDTQKSTNQNNVIKFSDNSSAIQGFTLPCLTVQTEKHASQLGKSLTKASRTRHVIYTAETHNFPTGVCPFEGAATGTGGRLRDVHATGRGAHEIAGIAGYSFGNLLLDGYHQPWENAQAAYPGNFASPKKICIEASNGASDYGNKFGEPVIAGFARSFGQQVETHEDDEQRVEYIKPIMFSAGIGQIDDELTTKMPPSKGLLVVKIGGPVYRIGVGGGSASSVEIQGGRCDELDFSAVQRGDAEMSNKLHRVIRACAELGSMNPILSIHDQGAGGNGNVLKEIVEGAGAVIDCRAFELGDPTISVKELWGAEYQESSAALVHPDKIGLLLAIGRRERCSVTVVGTCTDDNKIVLRDFEESDNYPVNLDLDAALGTMPQKVFQLDTGSAMIFPTELSLPVNLTVHDALSRVLRLPAVASKRYLTSKVDRSVTGLIAQQQCVGPCHTPCADVAVTALSYFDTRGAAVACGEQPIKMLLSPEAGARMSVAEAMTNLVFAPITDRKDIKCSGNWMWPAKLPGEGARLLAACQAMCRFMTELGIAVDGGKDSLSMAANVQDKVVKSPGTLVISTYAPCIDVGLVLTPELKCPNGRGILLYVPFGDPSASRLGGSALAQCYQQLGFVPADIDQPHVFAAAFDCTQRLVKARMLTAGHDISDGGLITSVMEMAFAANCEISIDVDGIDQGRTEFLFAEECGIVVECREELVEDVIREYTMVDVFPIRIGCSRAIYGPDAKISISFDGQSALEDPMIMWRAVWEQTSMELDKLQTDVDCVNEERKFLAQCRQLPLNATFEQAFVMPIQQVLSDPPRMAIVRDEGSNGDREMAAAFHLAGFQVFDILMQDLLDDIKVGMSTFNNFRGIAFVGGFSYADVLGSARGWASTIQFNDNVSRAFTGFFARPDTFSLGVCNGCQLMANIGWIGGTKSLVDEVHLDDAHQLQRVRLEHNDCGRFQSYFNCVRIDNSPSIMFKGMQGSVLGVWVSHGEGKFAYASGSVLAALQADSLIPLVYVDEQAQIADSYPMNPNGSDHGVAGVCSPDGRHLALMPHPERCFLSWQWPTWSGSWPDKATATCSPWMKMFGNAYDWCIDTASLTSEVQR